MQIDVSSLQLLPPIEILKQNLILYLPRLVGAIVILVIGLKSQPILNAWIRRFFQKVNYDESLERFIDSLFGIAYKIVIILFSVSIAGIETTSIVAALGAAGFAVGLALQGSMSNFASGILILTLKPIKVGEFIEIETSMGTVNKIEIFNTVLLTPDNKTIFIPNSELTSKVLINYSREEMRRVDLEIGIDYNSDIQKAKAVLTKAVDKHADLIITNEEKSSTIGISQLADSAILMNVFVWCYSKDYITLKRLLLENIKTELEKAKIGIPFPTFTIKK